MIRVGIVGATGYSGVELVRLLQHHPDVNIQHLYSSTAEGEQLAQLFPHLEQLALPALETIEAQKMAVENDVIFLAAPAGISSGLSPRLLAAGAKVIDLSGDFRLAAPDVYRQWYKKEPAEEKWLKQAVYGLPEWNREKIAAACMLANPGCYPTATLLALLPIAQTGWVDSRSWIIDAKSGVSGAGRGVSLGVHYSEINESISAYKVSHHQHTPEIEQELAKWTFDQSGQTTRDDDSSMSDHQLAIQFTPHLVPMTRGILVTAYASLRQSVTPEQLQELYETTYADKPFVRVRRPGSHPRTKEVYGSNYCDIAVHLDQRTNRVILLSVIDNVVKGAAGQAVQNMNLMFGLPETAGLPQVPIFP